MGRVVVMCPVISKNICPLVCTFKIINQLPVTFRTFGKTELILILLMDVYTVVF